MCPPDALWCYSVQLRRQWTRRDAMQTAFLCREKRGPVLVSACRMHPPRRERNRPPLNAPKHMISWKPPQLASDHSGGPLPATLIAVLRTAACPHTLRRGSYLRAQCPISNCGRHHVVPCAVDAASRCQSSGQIPSDPTSHPIVQTTADRLRLRTLSWGTASGVYSRWLHGAQNPDLTPSGVEADCFTKP